MSLPRDKPDAGLGHPCCLIFHGARTQRGPNIAFGIARTTPKNGLETDLTEAKKTLLCQQSFHKLAFRKSERNAFQTLPNLRGVLVLFHGLIKKFYICGLNFVN